MSQVTTPRNLYSSGMCGNSVKYSPVDRLSHSHTESLQQFRNQCSDLLSLLEDVKSSETKKVENRGNAPLFMEGSEPLDNITRDVGRLRSSTDKGEVLEMRENKEGVRNMIPDISNDEGRPSMRSAVCLAPFSLTGASSTNADINQLENSSVWITTSALRWFFFMLQRHRGTILSNYIPLSVAEKEFSALGELARETADELKKVMDSVEYLICQLSDPESLGNAQLRQLCLHISNRLVGVMELKGKLTAALLNQIAVTTSDSKEQVLINELKSSATLIAELYEENTYLKTQLATLEQENARSRDLAAAATLEKDNLTSHFERVAADNAELLSKMYELKETVESQPAAAVDEESESSKLREEHSRLVAQLQRQTKHVRELQECLEDSDAESRALRQTIDRLRQSLLRHRSVIDLLFRKDSQSKEASPEMIEEILSGLRDDELVNEHTQY